MSTINDPKLARVVLQREYDRWVDLLLQRRLWFQDQRIKLVERYSNQIVFFSSISAANLAIVAPLSTNNSSPSIFSTISFLGFFLNLTLGVIITITTLKIDEKDFENAKKNELAVFENLKESCLKALKDLTTENVTHYLNYVSATKEDLQMPTKPGIKPKILDSLYYVFIAFFFTGLISLALNIFYY